MFFLLDSTIHDIEEAFNSFVNRQDIAIIMITQKVSKLVWIINIVSIIETVFTMCVPFSNDLVVFY